MLDKETEQAIIWLFRRLCNADKIKVLNIIVKNNSSLRLEERSQIKPQFKTFVGGVKNG